MLGSTRALGDPSAWMSAARLVGLDYSPAWVAWDGWHGKAAFGLLIQVVVLGRVALLLSYALS